MYELPILPFRNRAVAKTYDTLLESVLRGWSAPNKTFENMAKERTKMLREAITTPFDTPDNQEAAKHLQFALQQAETCTKFFLSTASSKVSLSEIFSELEDDGQIPLSLQSQYPDLSPSEWESALRLVVRLLGELECTVRSDVGSLTDHSRQ